MANNSSENQRPFVVRLFIALIKFLFIVIVVAGGVGLGLYAYGQFSTVNLRLDELGRRVTRNSAEFQEYASNQDGTAALETELGSLSDDLEGLESDLEDVEASLADMPDAEALTALQTQVEDITQQTAAIGESITNVETALTTLESDVSEASGNVGAVNDMSAELSTLSSDLAALQENVNSLNDSLTALQSLQAGLGTPDGDPSALQDVFATLRVWGVVTRARLYLSEGNVGFAESSLQDAQTAVDDLIASTDSDALASALTPVQGRIEAAVGSLTEEDLEGAARNLDSAWESLDLILSAVIGPATAGEALDEELPPDPAGATQDDAADSEDEGSDTTEGEGDGADSGTTILPVGPTPTPEPEDEP